MPAGPKGVCPMHIQKILIYAGKLYIHRFLRKDLPSDLRKFFRYNGPFT